MRIILLLFSFLFMLGPSGIYAQNVKTDDPLNGPKKEYYPSGKLCREYIVSDGKICGVYKFYSEKGFLVSEQNMTDGLPNGLMRTFYESGTVESESYYKDGIVTGLNKEYYENGNLKSENNLTGNPWEYSGQTKTYRENGSVVTDAIFSQGKLAKSITYDLQGRVISEDTEGHSTSYWYENGTGKKHVVIDGKPQD